jgi:serine/threonine protein kinase
MPLDFAVSVIGQTCEALEFAHERGVIHRDIKPENIMISASEGVKVVDFGISKLANAPVKTTSGLLMGTPYYMSYEQAQGIAVVPGSDIYSLGIVLYEMLTGQWPFEGDPLTVVGKHLTDTPLAPRQLNPKIPSELNGAILRALEKDQARRFRHARAFAEAIGYRADQTLHVAIPVLTRSAPAPRAVNPRLVVTSGSMKGKVLACGAGTALSRSAVDPNDGLISRQHARLVQSGDQFFIEDLGSRNGTYVNGERLTGRRRLKPKDQVLLGTTHLIFEV